MKVEDLPPFVAPYTELLPKMAYFASQLSGKKQIKAIRLELAGEVSDYA